MRVCSRCWNEVNGVVETIKFNHLTGRCSKCEGEVRQALNRFQTAFRGYCANGRLSEQEFAWLEHSAALDKIDFLEALAYIRADSLRFLDQALLTASESEPSDEIDNVIKYLLWRLAIPEEMSRRVLGKLDYCHQLQNVRAGNLPRSRPSIQLDSTEICYLEVPATKLTINTKPKKLATGHLMITNTKIRFLSPSLNTVVSMDSVICVKTEPDKVRLQLSLPYDEYYAVDLPILIEAVISARLRQYQYLKLFRQAFLGYCVEGILSEQDWSCLQTAGTQDGIDPAEAVSYIRKDALHQIDRVLSFAASNGMIDDEEANRVDFLLQKLAVPEEVARPVLERLSFLCQLTRIREGALPTITPSVRLDSTEICHLETPATYYRVNTKSLSQTTGRLLVTNRKIHFLSPNGGTEIPWKSVMRVSSEPGGIYIELSRKNGNGIYEVESPLVVVAIIDTVLRLSRREILAPSTNTMTRHIPQEVRTAVWQRDQGKCVQCGASTWLEFDHIIPHSLGGANTVGNVQLLCRSCNLQKSNRI